MKKILILLTALILIIGVVAIGVFFLFTPGSTENQKTNQSISEKPNQTRNYSSKVNETGSTEEGIKEVVNANNEFAFDLYSKLKNEKGNIFYSPYSLSAALAMTYEGARGKTADEIKSVFHFPEPSKLRPNFAAIYAKINNPNKTYELNTGNALWIQKDYPVLEDYKKIIKEYYGGKVANLDFARETEKSRQIINNFIAQQTNNKIKDLIPEGYLDGLTRVVLTNAIYFKGKWKFEFNKSNTREEDFKTPAGIVKTPMMYMEEASFKYAELEKLQILELPYKGENISMLILLPKQGSFYDPEKESSNFFNYTLEDIELTSEKLEEYKAQMRETTLDEIYLPKFEFDSKYFMKGTLSSIGMATAFSSAADFSGIDGTHNLFISDVIHQAYIKVDEEGTEAAGATAVIMMKSAMPTSKKILRIFKADHPFIFIIQEKNTGNILFVGRVSDPTKNK